MEKEKNILCWRLHENRCRFGWRSDKIRSVNLVIVISLTSFNINIIYKLEAIFILSPKKIICAHIHSFAAWICIKANIFKLVLRLLFLVVSVCVCLSSILDSLWHTSYYVALVCWAIILFRFASFFFFIAQRGSLHLHHDIMWQEKIIQIQSYTYQQQLCPTNSNRKQKHRHSVTSTKGKKSVEIFLENNNNNKWN